MNKIDELLKNYLKSDNTDYAIMIIGDWGCGKSYYIHHDFKDIIENDLNKNDSTSSYLIVSYDISIKIPASDMFLKDTCWSVVNKNIDNEVLKTNQIRFFTNE